MLQEKLRAAEGRAATAERWQTDGLELAKKLSAAEAQQQAWQSAARGLGLDGPQEVFEKLGDLRSQILSLESKLAERDAELRKAAGMHPRSAGSNTHLIAVANLEG